MQGRFEGLTESQIALIEPLFPSPLTVPGISGSPFRKVLNTVLWVLINGAECCSVPVGEQRSPRSADHDRPGKWEEDGTWAEILSCLCGIAGLSDMIRMGSCIGRRFIRSRKRRRR